MKISLRSTLWAAAASLFTAGSGALASAHSVPAATAIPVFMLVTILVAWRAGFQASLTVAIVATLGLDFFFTEPRQSLKVASLSELFALFTFAVISTLVSHLSDRIRVKSDLLRAVEEQRSLLYEFSQQALLIDWRESVEAQLCQLILTSFRLSGVAILTAENPIVEGAGDNRHSEERLHASFRALRNYDLPKRLESLRILRSGVRPIGALLLRGAMDAVLADSIATLASTHLERVRSMKSEVRAQSQSISERLRTAVLDGLAHAVKTPLTTIIASSSGLREIGPLTAVQAELAATIEDQASYLSKVTNKLLRTANLETREVQVLSRPSTLREVFARTEAELQLGRDLGRLQAFGRLDAHFLVDPDLLTLILVQVIENALKFSPAMSPVSAVVSLPDGTIQISIHNDGSFIPRAEQALVFERYYRGRATEHKASGTGIGLSAAKHAAEAMGGQIWFESSPQAGTTFHITLPLQEMEGNKDASGLNSAG